MSLLGYKYPNPNNPHFAEFHEDIVQVCDKIARRSASLHQGGDGRAAAAQVTLRDYEPPRMQSEYDALGQYDAYDPLRIRHPEDPARTIQEGGRFVWETDEGDLLFLSEMATQHLFFALRMLFNHSVPPAFRVGTFKRHDKVFGWSADYRGQAIRVMFHELVSHRELDADIQAELNDIQANARVILQLGI